MPLIARVLAEAGKTYADLGAVIVVCGPGGFTGLRVGMAAAQGLAIALQIPLYGISSLQALALSESAAGNILVAIDTKRGDNYAQVFDASRKPLNDAWVCTDTQTQEFLKSYGAALSAQQPIDCTRIAQLFAQGERHFFIENPAPLYLRPPEVTQSKQAQRILETKRNA